MESSDTESDHSDSEMKIDESYNSFKHHNGFATNNGHEHTNGHNHVRKSISEIENRTHNSNNDKIYNDVQKMIKNFGFRKW